MIMVWSKKYILIGLVVILMFFVLRFYGIDSPYHQDEYKWPIIVNPALTEPGGIPHPPVGEFIYREAGKVVGYDNFRIIPLVFSFFNLLLLFYLAKLAGDKRSALWSAFFYAVSFYSVLASLMVDTDGAIMPFFFLIMAIAYVKLKSTSYEMNRQSAKWLALLLLGMAGGFFVKASFIIGIAAIMIDFAVERGAFSEQKKLVKYLIYSIFVALALAGLLFVAKIIFPFFNIQSSFQYWKHFFRISGRGWMQTFIQFAKALMYLSPLLVVPALFADREIFRKTRPFFIFITLGLVFYLLIFDFSTGALDRYFQFLIIPLCLISGTVFAKYMNQESLKQSKLATGQVRIMNYAKNKEFFIPIILSFFVFLMQFFNHNVHPLHPKAEWIGRVLSFKWNFLFPFTGGSGPLGFYVSFAFIAVFWILSAVFVAGVLLRRGELNKALFAILVIGFLYNGVFIEEYLFGNINGSSRKLVAEAAQFIKENPDIKKVVVYNDNGGYEIQKLGKYEKRLYTSPQFDLMEKIQTLNRFSGHILEIDIPPIDPKSIFRKYLDSCQVIYKQKYGYINANIYNCRFAPDIKI